MNPDSTVVTAIDSAYFWGAYLLVASIRAGGVRCPIHVLGYQLSDEEVKGLAGFPNVRVIPLERLDWQHFVCVKPQALLTAETEYVTWMDADCLVTGDISPYLSFDSPAFSAQFRGEGEQTLLARTMYKGFDVAEGSMIPEAVLQRWRRDVGERERPRITSTCSTCCFTIHRSHFPFLQRWQDQMRRVLPPRQANGHARVVDSNLPPAYWQVDEAVLNSLLAYADDVPDFAPYVLDSDPQAYVIHFVTSPKPWKLWLPDSQSHYERVMNVLEWADSQSEHDRMDRPFSLRPGNRWLKHRAGDAYASLSGLMRKSPVMANAARQVLRSLR